MKPKYVMLDIYVTIAKLMGGATVFLTLIGSVGMTTLLHDYNFSSLWLIPYFMFGITAGISILAFAEFLMLAIDVECNTRNASQR